MDHIHSISSWDPSLSEDWIRATPSNLCLRRIQIDVMRFHKEPPAGIYVATDEQDVSVLHVLVVGPEGTPYQGGFFYFLIRFPPDYPIRPPRVKLMTTGQGKVRFNPNLYKNGKVCLSIIGTWSGPSWKPVQTLSSVLLSIQSLMSDKPYFNEPGYDMEITDHRLREMIKGASDEYNKIITHETIRVAVCGMVGGTMCDSRNMPGELKRHVERIFLQNYQHYLDVCDKNAKLEGETMQDPHGSNRGKFVYAELKKRLQELRASVEKNLNPEV